MNEKEWMIRYLTRDSLKDYLRIEQDFSYETISMVFGHHIYDGDFLRQIIQQMKYEDRKKLEKRIFEHVCKGVNENLHFSGNSITYIEECNICFFKDLKEKQFIYNLERKIGDMFLKKYYQWRSKA